jgi:hypothetical protein
VDSLFPYFSLMTVSPARGLKSSAL